MSISEREIRIKRIKRTNYSTGTIEFHIENLILLSPEWPYDIRTDRPVPIGPKFLAILIPFDDCSSEGRTPVLYARTTYKCTRVALSVRRMSRPA